MWENLSWRCTYFAVTWRRYGLCIEYSSSLAMCSLPAVTIKQISRVWSQVFCLICIQAIVFWNLRLRFLRLAVQFLRPRRDFRAVFTQYACIAYRPNFLVNHRWISSDTVPESASWHRFAVYIVYKFGSAWLLQMAVGVLNRHNPKGIFYCWHRVATGISIAFVPFQ